MTNLTLFVPVYNEIKTIKILIDKLLKLNIPSIEILVVDDYSSDGTKELLKKLSKKSKYKNIKILYHKQNTGKGGAIQTGLKKAKGEYFIIQDADLEYNPSDIKKLYQLAKKENIDILYGSRFMGKITGMAKANFIGNKVFNFQLNLLYGSKITDMHSCYKLIKTKLLRSLEINETGFDFDTVISCRVLNMKYKIYEYPISYTGRNQKEGKKITIFDGFKCMYKIFQYRFFHKKNIKSDSQFSSTKKFDYEGKDLEAMSHSVNYNSWLIEQFEPFIGNNIVEVGAGQGVITKELLKKYKKIQKILAIEPSKKMYLLLEKNLGKNKKIKTKNGFTQKFTKDFSNHFYDTFIYSNVLEHIKDDDGELLFAYNSLPKNGRILTFSPALPQLYGKSDQAVGHYRRYYLKEMTEKMTRAGFVIEKAYYFDFIGMILWWGKFKLFKAEYTDSSSVKFFDKFFVPLSRFFDLSGIIPLGKNIVVIGKKL
jgi:glycosyltransferase involved in cell wall biosynthesis